MEQSMKEAFAKRHWQRFAEYFGDNFPFSAQASVGDLSWIEPYVQNILRQTLSRTDANRVEPSFAPWKYELFDTISHVIIKLEIPDKNRARNTRVLAGTHQVRLEEGTGVRSTAIPLPAAIVPESGRAFYKEGVLQIQLKKRQREENLQEIRIRFLS
jgi:HSP20 family molecular chaperone IbpA